jgi:myo-inositol-1(or 4)-monophosphatase
MTLDLLETLSFVRDLAQEQGRQLLERWPAIGELSYKNNRDFTTQADIDIEVSIKAALTARFPDHSVSGEETGDDNRDAEYRWLIDPIDGTKYYAAQSTLFSVSVALLRRQEPILGVVYLPTSDQGFYAYSGGGAFLDGKRLTGPDTRELSAAIVNIDTPRSDALSEAERVWFEQRLLLLTRNTYRVRALGLGSLAACWLATGAFDAYLDLTGYVKPHDIAAGRIILEEAGLQLEYIEPIAGPPRLLAAPRSLWDALRELMMGTNEHIDFLG